MTPLYDCFVVIWLKKMGKYDIKPQASADSTLYRVYITYSWEWCYHTTEYFTYTTAASIIAGEKKNTAGIAANGGHNTTFHLEPHLSFLTSWLQVSIFWRIVFCRFSSQTFGQRKHVKSTPFNQIWSWQSTILKELYFQWSSVNYLLFKINEIYFISPLAKSLFFLTYI